MIQAAAVADVVSNRSPACLGIIPNLRLRPSVEVQRMHPQSVASQRVSEIVHHHHGGIADSRCVIEATWETTQSVLNGFGVSILEKRREELQGFKLRPAGGICDVVLPFGPIPSRLRPFRLGVRKVL